MLYIDFLKNHPSAINALAEIHYEVLGKIWFPQRPISKTIENLNTHLNDTRLPLTLVAFKGPSPVGMCSLRVDDGLGTTLTPWLGSLVVDPGHQKQGIAKKLIEETKNTARTLGFDKLYLFALDKTIPQYYETLGWRTIGQDKYLEYPVTVMITIL